MNEYLFFSGLAQNTQLEISQQSISSPRHDADDETIPINGKLLLILYILNISEYI